jgi:hypothetical protein
MVGNRKNIIRVGVAGYLPCSFGVARAVMVQPDMLRVFVRRCIYNHIIQPEILTGLHYSYGDFASVRNEDFTVHNNPVLLIQFV